MKREGGGDFKLVISSCVVEYCGWICVIDHSSMTLREVDQ